VPLGCLGVPWGSGSSSCCCQTVPLWKLGVGEGGFGRAGGKTWIVLIRRHAQAPDMVWECRGLWDGLCKQTVSGVVCCSVNMWTSCKHTAAAATPGCEEHVYHCSTAGLHTVPACNHSNEHVKAAHRHCRRQICCCCGGCCCSYSLLLI
jgi:hypothetical protein